MYHESMTEKDKWEDRLEAPKDNYERWIDKHNHKLEFIRTIGSIIAAITGVLVFLKVFKII
jgi:hypothetical protein